MCQVAGLQGVFSTPGRNVRAVLSSPTSLHRVCTGLHARTGAMQPAPLIPPTQVSCTKGPGRDGKKQGHDLPPLCLLHSPPAPGNRSRAFSAVLLSAKAGEAPCILTKERTCQRKPQASIRIQLPELEGPRCSRSPSVCHVGK